MSDDIDNLMRTDLQRTTGERDLLAANLRALKADLDKYRDIVAAQNVEIRDLNDALSEANVEMARMREDRDKWQECARRIALERRGDEMAAIHEAERMRPVYEAAVKWHRIHPCSEQGHRDKHAAFGRLAAAIDTAQEGK